MCPDSPFVVLGIRAWVWREGHFDYTALVNNLYLDP